MKKTQLLGFSMIIIAIVILFFSPILWENYKNWFGVDLNKNSGGATGVIFSIFFIVVINIGVGFYLISKEDK